MRCESHASVFCIRASSTPSTRGCSASASASTREYLVSASNSTREFSLLGVESALSGRGENTFGRLGESVGVRLRSRGRGSERVRRLGGRGELGGAETLRAWRARGVQGAYSVRACAVWSA